jgi:subtilisin family serine protease
VTGSIEVGSLDALAGTDGVLVVEGSRPMLRELDLAVVDSRANLVHTGPPGHRGTGVIVGIVDSGIDWTHDCFRRADGTTRILSIWDQFLTPQAGESNPPGFSYGVEYTRAQIDAALAGTGNVRHTDGDTQVGHGTHVAGIAAGDGSAAGGPGNPPAGTFVGVAPEADIIVVANQGGNPGLGDSARTLDAINYIFQRAAAVNRPVVVNQSQGDNLGPHDGTSLLERGIDNLLGGAGRAMVKSAGNAAADRIHAEGTVTAGAPQIVQFTVGAGDTTPETIDIWYEGADRFAFRITEPGGPTSATVNPGNSTTLNLGNGNSVFVDSRTADPNNGDNRIFLTISRGSAATLEAGTWSFTLTGTTVVNGRFDAWIQRGNRIASFNAPHENPARTISTPGTANEVITAASYITRGAGVGGISAFSSRGPTRDGRPAPDVAAPGQLVISARASTLGGDTYHSLQGTSMASPHVAGAVALMLQANPNLTQQQIKDCLRNNARSDAFTGATPNNTWGGGKLDVRAAFDCASPPQSVAQPCVIQTVRGPACGQVPISIRRPCILPTRSPLLCIETLQPSCIIQTTQPDCLIVTRDPGCLQPTLVCPVSLGPRCGGPVLGPEPVVNPIVNPAAGPRGRGRTIIGQEDASTGKFVWYAFDPYGELEGTGSSDDETWTEPTGQDEPGT